MLLKERDAKKSSRRIAAANSQRYTNKYGNSGCT